LRSGALKREVLGAQGREQLLGIGRSAPLGGVRALVVSIVHRSEASHLILERPGFAGQRASRTRRARSTFPCDIAGEYRARLHERTPLSTPSELPPPAVGDFSFARGGKRCGTPGDAAWGRRLSGAVANPR
jgi:hypothetical protein